MFVFSWEQGITGEQLHHYASKRPDVDCTGVRYSKDDFRSPVKPTLNVGVNLLLLVAPTANVDHLDSRFIFVLEHDVLRFKVTVNYSVLSEELQTLEDLNSEADDQVH